MSKAEFPQKESESYKKASIWREYFWVIFFSIIGLLAINAIFLSKAFRGDEIDPEKADHLGSFVGGYVGSFLGLISVLFLYITFRDQRQSSNLEKFENKYFELLRLHRENVSEIGIGRDYGKKIFVKLIQEFRSLCPIVKDLAQKHNVILSEEQVFVVSYLVLFFGIGDNSSRILKNSLKELPETFIKSLINSLDDRSTKHEGGKQSYTYDGHQSRLGHYYRHLYQTIMYVDKKNDITIDKYSYVKTVRAQLSNHEQALLFINSLSPLGKNWWNETLIQRYELVKNLPEGFFDKEKEIDLESYFPGNYFEYQKAKYRIFNNRDSF